MASIFIVGEKDSADLWLVDTGAGTVQPLTGEAGASVEAEFVERVQAMRGNGFAILKSVDVAIAASARDELTSREFSQND